MSHPDTRARLAALLLRVVSRKDAPRTARAVATAAAVAAPVAVATAAAVAAPVAAPVTAPVAAPTPVVHAPVAPRAVVEPVLRATTRTAPLVAREPPPEPARIPPEDLFEPEPAGPEISEGDESIEIATSSLDLASPVADDLYDLREPAPVAPIVEPAALFVDEPMAVFAAEPEALADAAAPVTPPLTEPEHTQLYDARPLPAAQRARVVAMPLAAPTSLRELVRRSMELRVRRPHRP